MPTITERAVLGMFYERLSQNTGTGYLDAICTPAFNSDQDSEDYAWLGQVPQLSERQGEKKFSQLRKTPWTVRNVEYQGGIAIPKKDILYDKTGQVRVRVNEMADRSQSHWAKLAAQLIIDGESGVCYDGQYFFDTDHSEGDSGSQSNDISVDLSDLPASVHGSTTYPSAGEAVLSIMKAVDQIIGFKDDRGEYVNENATEFLVMAGTGLGTPLLSALRARSIDGGDTNVLIEQDSYRIRLQVTPRLNTWTSKFAVFNTQGEQKPIIRQQRRPNNEATGYDVEGMLLEMLWLESEYCKLHGECLVSVETERAAAYGDWKKACLVTLTA
ncbi:MAG TPA: Mu-like prophage major head subunit gpT family protein [Methylophilaceae bacterium]|nr:Mu-like prophage major head subunit gpT family protein [Methylophilaceae bacterium]